MITPNTNTAHLVVEIDHLCLQLKLLEEGKVHSAHKQAGEVWRDTTQEHIADLRGHIHELQAFVARANASRA